jgi:class 3 adenylate cyclase
VWVLLSWGAAIVIHLGVVLAVGLFGGRARRRRRAMAREARRAAHELHRQAHAAKAERRQERMQRRGPNQGVETPKPPSGPERKWVTVMFTDIANSTGLTEELGDDEWSRLLSGHRDLVRSLFVSHGGQVVGTQGDGCLGRFPTPAEAVLCAVDMQKEIAQTRHDTDFPLEVRIGIHAGEAVEDDGDLVGRVVNVAARVTSETKPGEILVTEPVADYLGGELRFEDRGLRELRGLSQPRHLLAVRWDEDVSPQPPASTSGTEGGSPPGVPPAAPAAAAPPGTPPPPPAPPS